MDDRGAEKPKKSPFLETGERDLDGRFSGFVDPRYRRRAERKLRLEDALTLWAGRALGLAIILALAVGAFTGHFLFAVGAIFVMFLVLILLLYLVALFF